MKYGIVYYKDTDNIGDDIQSYAALRLLPQMDYLIDREHLDDFKTEETVAVILNGWFLHNKFNWPPSPNLYPCCISMHFTPNDYMSIGYDYLEGVGREYLKNYQPIGCRDQSTLEILHKKGIEAYLSGCVTLTLGQREVNRSNERYICMVDISEEAQNKIDLVAKKEGIYTKKVTHWVDYKNQPIGWRERIKQVEKLLDLYQSAYCVVTKRLHCALPCLAMGTPVLLLLDREKDDMTRYSHFTDLLHVTSTEDFIRGKCEFDVISPPENKRVYENERKQLIDRIEKFVLETKKVGLPDCYLNWQKQDKIRILKWQKDLAGFAAVNAAKEVDSLLIQRGKTEEETCEKISNLSKQHKNDLDVMQKYIADKEKEEKRLNNVIADKEEEEKRLNNVIVNKDVEQRQLNYIITEKTEIINGIQQRLENNEKSSIVWLIFFSAEFAKAAFKDKCKMIVYALKNHSGRKRFNCDW